MEVVCLGRLVGSTCFVHTARYPALFEFLLPSVLRLPRLGSRPSSPSAFPSESQVHSSSGSLSGCGHFVSYLQKRDCAPILLAQHSRAVLSARPQDVRRALQCSGLAVQLFGLGWDLRSFLEKHALLHEPMDSTSALYLVQKKTHMWTVFMFSVH